MDWYALYVKTGQEDLVRKMIRKFYGESTVSAIVPKRKLLEKKQGQIYEVYKTMFPGYVLLRMKLNAKLYNDLKIIPKSYRILKNGCNDINKKNQSRVDRISDGTFEEQFSKIREEEMSLILQLIGNGEVIDYSTLYVKNTVITVCNGPLKGKEGIIKNIDKRKKRARISMAFGGSERLLDVGIEMLAVEE